MELAVRICRDILPLFPPSEQHALTDQLRRAVQSIPANIAEGFGRYSYQEAIHFCNIARGSLTECYSHLSFALRMEYLPEPVFDTMRQDLTDVHRVINGYITYLKRTRQAASEKPRKISELLAPYELFQAEKVGQPVFDHLPDQSNEENLES
jgi:four helix bundle protein